ncbi:hypothetical protein [Paenibacillus cremeus]|uniref:TfoX N-terminal domain-containing protein n=1 Tax=Paenibacillus cremeus TaxID=2163881 RepID=A0A559K983_9BACL|nr:hypothetical protein [Paenibacillus cremeus]TVY08691.1 hypothetical protein FPZ49_17890 [Paenibacillus cremeus]
MLYIGKLCLKYEGKAFASFFEEEMVFKLSGAPHANALQLAGAQLFDPSGKKRPMKDWVQVPYAHVESWMDYAEAALNQLREAGA